MKQDIIRLWSACNQKCLFCNQEDIFDVKKKKQILSELLWMKQKKVERLVVSWWEPTLFKKELLFTLSVWKKLWFKMIELQSNAVLLANNNYVLELKEKWLDTSMISLHSYDSDTSDFLTQASWTHKKTLEGIHNLIEAWIKTTLNIVINNSNYIDLLKYVQYVHENILGFSDISFSVVVPGKLTKENRLLPQYKYIAPHLIEAYQYCIENNIRFQNPWCGIPVCYVKEYYKYSLEYQNYKTWNKYDEFILNKNKWNKVKSDKCRQCIFDSYCLWVWYWYAEIHWVWDISPILKL